eukprot:Gb_24717 [translate_table: standard]
MASRSLGRTVSSRIGAGRGGGKVGRGSGGDRQAEEASSEEDGAQAGCEARSTVAGLFINSVQAGVNAIDGKGGDGTQGGEGYTSNPTRISTKVTGEESDGLVPDGTCDRMVLGANNEDSQMGGNRGRSFIKEPVISYGGPIAGNTQNRTISTGAQKGENPPAIIEQQTVYIGTMQKSANADGYPRNDSNVQPEAGSHEK